MKTPPRQKTSAVILIFGLLSIGMPPPAGASSEILAKSALVVNKKSGKVLFSRNIRQTMPPASTVKLLTALVVLDELPLEHVIRVHSAATHAQPTKINLQAGESMSVRDLLKSILISSANDSAKALAIGVAGSESAFAAKMNTKARRLGAARSNFTNASGLPQENQYSTAEDLLKITQAADKVPFIMQTLRIKETAVYTREGRRVYLKSHNKMFWRDSRPFIGKTGWTRNARHCFAGQMGSGDKAAYVIVLGSANKWKDLARLADIYVDRIRSSNVKASVSARGKNVIEVQRALKNAGFFNREPTGFFGPVTEQAVIRFQRANQLKQDGIVGPKTWDKLSRYL